MVVGANTSDYVLDSSMFVRELLNGTLKATYLVGPRGPEYRRDDQAGTIRWYVYDGLGSVVGEVDPSGNLTRAQSFDVYGCVRTSSGAATTKHKFVGALGHPSDDETGLIYMRARHYDPVCGRFVSEDPAQSGTNWLNYCAADPVNSVDPTGKRLDVPSMQCAELFAGYMTLAITLLFMAALASCPGPCAFETAICFIWASGAAYLIADALKDVVYPNAAAMGAFLLLASAVINRVFAVALTPPSVAAGWFPALGNAIGALVATSIVAEVYMITMD
jgi:RHS repeat-associated protein